MYVAPVLDGLSVDIVQVSGPTPSLDLPAFIHIPNGIQGSTGTGWDSPKFGIGCRR